MVTGFVILLVSCALFIAKMLINKSERMTVCQIAVFHEEVNAQTKNVSNQFKKLQVN